MLAQELDVFVQEVFSGEVFIQREVVDLLEDQQFMEIEFRPCPSPEQIPTGPQIHTMRQLPPALHPQKRGRHNIINLLPGLHHPIMPGLLLLIKPPVQILIKDTQPRNHRLDIYVSCLGVHKQLARFIYVYGIAAIEGGKQWFAIVVGLEDLVVDAEDCVELFHYYVDVEDGLGGGFQVVDGEQVVEAGIDLEVVLDVGWERFGDGDYGVGFLLFLWFFGFGFGGFLRGLSLRRWNISWRTLLCCCLRPITFLRHLIIFLLAQQLCRLFLILLHFGKRLINLIIHNQLLHFPFLSFLLEFLQILHRFPLNPHPVILRIAILHFLRLFLIRLLWSSLNANIHFLVIIIFNPFLHLIKRTFIQ